jgi:hypothetical protein
MSCLQKLGEQHMKVNAIVKIASVLFISIALFILPNLWGWSGLPLAIMGAVLALTTLLVGWHARHTGYQCTSCSYTFSISPITDFLSPHLAGVKMLRCPRCGHSGWTPEISRQSITDPPPENTTPAILVAHGRTSLYLQIVAVLALYLVLWIYTFAAWPQKNEFLLWDIVKIPAVTVILPILQVVFCLFALRQGYRSRIYFFVSLFVIVFLLLAIWMQRVILTRL